MQGRPNVVVRIDGVTSGTVSTGICDRLRGDKSPHHA